ncbi:efflux RND transporter periplasmic adaptor subunit [bacterium]|nr:efflux RND transporter periplasmic adaptor subunit [bacterium]
MRRFIFIIAIVAAFGLGLVLRGGGSSSLPDAGHAEDQAEAPTTWTCSMHPQIQLPEFGKCPICFMDLIPVDMGDEEDLGPRTLVLSEAAASLAEIQTAAVERRRVESRIRLIGEVAVDETRNRAISAWVPGRIDTLFVDYTGTVVAKGDALVSLYSPTLYAAQAELLNALTATEELRESPDPLMRRTAAATVTSARERLRLWGLTPAQIDDVEGRGSARHHLRITSPLGGVVIHKNALEGRYVEKGSLLYTVADLSHVWIAMEAYESDLAWLAEGQDIDFTVEALPGRSFAGTVVFIDPVLDPRTRTAMVRLEADNAKGLLKPGMFVHATVAAESGDEALPLVIPASAPLITGERAVVYVRLPDRDKPTFEGREITLGPRAGDHYLVVAGLAEGERVVTKGNFKLDSALQIQAKPSMMNPTGGGPAPGHDHGGQAMAAAPGDEPDDLAEIPDVPAAFGAELGAVLEAYLALQAALAGDDDAAADAAAGAAVTTVDGVDMSLAGPAHAAWMEDAGRLRRAFATVADADDLAARRASLQRLTDAVWNALRRYGYRNDETVRLFHCPMYGPQGADWLQRETAAANPYYGASMLRCGSQTDSLPAATDGEGR